MRTEPVTITVHLPSEIAAQARTIEEEDPVFLSRVVLYGLTRLNIYRHLRGADRGKAQGKV